MIGTWNEILFAIITSIIGVYALAVAQYGWILGDKVSVFARILLLAAAACLIHCGVYTDLIGAVCIVAAIMIHKPAREKVLAIFRHKRNG
ncbi:hypothetical protein SDC9_177733 [bioreactor metagenome]|uniref:Uncharacterized protein n=1 Tax=bioreactor metagenome TaxID=1076179 RepID=A0A645GVA4_9ZZZZ